METLIDPTNILQMRGPPSSTPEDQASAQYLCCDWIIHVSLMQVAMADDNKRHSRW